MTRLLVSVDLDVEAANVPPLVFETTVTAVYRSGPGGKWADDYVGCVAYIPPDKRRGISPGLYSAWVGVDYMRVRAYVKDNKRTLRPFVASGEKDMQI